MVPPSSFVILVITVWSSSHLLLTQSLEVGKLPSFLVEIPNNERDSQPLKNGKLRNIANELAMDYLFEENKENLQPQVTLAKRDPPSDQKDDAGDGDIRSMYQHFVRRNIPPSLVKFNYGKRSDDKRFKTPFVFGKREDMDQADDSKRGLNPFTFGKRELELTNWDDEKRARYNPFMFGKRHDDDMEKRGGYSSLYFGKRIPEMAKKGFSRFYFGKRDLSDNAKRFSKFVFGKRDNDEGNLELENRDDLSVNKRFKPAFYFGKRIYPNDHENTNDMDEV